jgi:5-methylcytosine-specific restriction endonuclease McrA
MSERSWVPEARELRRGGRSYKEIERAIGVPRGQVYWWLNRGRKWLPDRVCVGCGCTFSPKNRHQRYHDRDCWGEYRPPSASTRPEVAEKISKAKTKSGNAALRRRQAARAGCTLAAKGESCCRNCGSGDWLNLHHVIPRSLWKAGIVEPLNCIPLCTACHLGWHRGRVVLYRDIFHDDEWALLSTAPLLGRMVGPWLDRHYPVRG